MCYAIPGKVKKIESGAVIVDYFGEERRAHNEMKDISIGDYIYAQGGFVIRKISSQEAEEILAAWKEMFFALQEVDTQISRIEKQKKGIDEKITRILDRAMEGIVPTKDEVLYLLKCDDPVVLEYIFKAANFLRKKHLKNSCCVHGILEISNTCNQHCKYCGITVDNKGLTRYHMSIDEIINAAYEAIETYGFKALVLQSGEDNGYSIDELAYAIKTIKERSPALIFISFGEIGIEGLQKLYTAGARGLLMRFETSNQDLYASLHPGRSLNSRLEHIKSAYEMGYLILTGGLVGLPGQTKEDISNDIFLARELHAEMFSFGPFLPHPQTELAQLKPINNNEMLKVLAVSRLIDPHHAKILVTTAFETLHHDARRGGLLAGANSVMLNVTPLSYREHYAIYPNRAYEHDVIEKQIDETIALLHSLGRAPTDLGARKDS
ncbi:radical SAM protein [Candidatus Omnitrophota bacterium]